MYLLLVTIQDEDQYIDFYLLMTFQLGINGLLEHFDMNFTTGFYNSDESVVEMSSRASDRIFEKKKKLQQI